jgi:hypothetical protein
VNSEPGSDDFKKVDTVFEKNAANPVTADEGLKLYLARNPGSPFKTRQDIANSPDIDKSRPRGGGGGCPGNDCPIAGVSFSH